MDRTPYISICIPTYEQNGVGAKHLRQLLINCFNQNTDFLTEIVISDNSADNSIKKIADSFYACKFPVRYIHNEKRGVANNSNHAIDQAKGKIIKLMYMDDYFLSGSALWEFSNALFMNEDVSWCISDSHWVDADGKFIKEFNGHYSDKLTKGHNTIGMPSVIAFKKTDIRFDPNLKTSLDSFFYYQLFKKYGPPAKITRPLIAQRIHENSISSIQRNNAQSDIMYMRKKISQDSGTKRSFPFGGAGTGAKSYASLCKTPSDINEHLPLLKEIAMQCDHIVEFGVRDVVSTYALIEGTPKTICSYDIKASPQITPATKHATQMGVQLKYLVIDVLKLQPVETDFLFIDTLHNYEQLSQELVLHASGVRKFIGFHDVTTFGLKDEQGEGKTKTGLLPAIIEFLLWHPEWHVHRYNHFNNGLLILKKSIC